MLLGSHAGESQAETGGKKRRLEEGDDEGDEGEGGDGDEDLFGDDDKDAGAGHEASSSRFAAIARLCALALLRAISLDPSTTPAVLGVFPSKDASKTGKKGRHGGIEKNQRAAVWSIRTVLQLLPSALASSNTGGSNGGSSGSAAEGTLGKRASSAQRVVEDVVQTIWEVVIVP
jgi:hypothetical protein